LFATSLRCAKDAQTLRRAKTLLIAAQRALFSPPIRLPPTRYAERRDRGCPRAPRRQHEWHARHGSWPTMFLIVDMFGMPAAVITPSTAPMRGDVVSPRARCHPRWRCGAKHFMSSMMQHTRCRRRDDTSLRATC